MERFENWLLWQWISGMALLGWVLTLFVITALEYIAYPTYVHDTAVNILISAEAIRFATALFAGGVIYGSLVQAASKHYVSQELSQPSSQHLPVEGVRGTLLWKDKKRHAASAQWPTPDQNTITLAGSPFTSLD